MTVAATLSVLSGCFFTQWTDRAFIGAPTDPPTHANRAWIGALVLPLAVAGDIITAPGQVIALMIVGDWEPYHRPRQRVAPDSGGGYSSIDASSLRVAGLDAENKVIDLALTDDQRIALAARLENHLGGKAVQPN
ncbi:MAG: hypothetical protein ABR538_09080 [Candidatus Binatia bacterium]